MATNPTPTTEAQEQAVYDGICALSAHCDGAVSLDEQGFNGTDTKFGKRIAAVPFDAWTPEIRAEAAHIIYKYSQQVLAYTGVDVTTLPIVREAQDFGTNYAARDQARGFERKARHLADRMIEVEHGKLGIRWASKDPDFSTFLDLVRRLPGRRWDGVRKVNVVDVTPEVEVFIDDFDFNVSPEAAKLLANPPVTTPKPNVWLADNGRRIVIATPYDPQLVDAVRSLPGRSWDGADKVNTVDIHPAVLDFAKRFNLVVEPAVVKAVEGAARALEAEHAAQLAKEDLETVLGVVSRTNKPEDLPPAFIELLKGVLS